MRLSELATEKRPPFVYEREIRALLKLKAHGARKGVNIPWGSRRRPRRASWSTPDADQAFHDTVKVSVAKFAPTLEDRISWSRMRTPPVL